jgi:hypothetical protein
MGSTRVRSKRKRVLKSEIQLPPLPSPTSRLPRLLIVVAGIILGQSLMYGPCLIGKKILLPLDTLTKPGGFIPRTPEIAKVQEWDRMLSDRVYGFEPARRFAARELHAGRLPLWTPYYFAGAPFLWPTFSPFALLQCSTESPTILAWAELATALVAGFGMYLFCRRVLVVGFWPACVCAWCYPLTGFFIMWQGFPLTQTVSLLPWLLLAVDGTARRKHGLAPVGLAMVTALMLISGRLDMAGQCLLVSGLYALWCVWDEYGRKCFSPPARRAVLGLVLGWTLGFMISTPQVLPTVEYTRTGSRMESRAKGAEERPPAGPVALPHALVPDYYGRTTSDTLSNMPYKPGNLEESAVGAYAGVIAMLFVAPLAFWSRRHRSFNLFLAALAIFGLSWILNLPIIVGVLRLPGLNMMSHNRLVFATCFAFVALAGVGLEMLSKGTLRWQRWHWLLVLPLALLSGLCMHRALVLPEPFATEWGLKISRGEKIQWVQNMSQLHQVQAWFRDHLLIAGAICATGAIFWCLLGFRKPLLTRLLFPVTCVGLMLDLIWFTQKRQPQCDPALYYPRIPALEQTARAKPGRVIGYGCLPPNLASMAGLRDIRGYDAADPANFVELLTRAPQARNNSPSYAITQNFVPKITFFANGDIRLPAVLDMLGVRYVIFRGQPYTNARPLFTSFDYYVVENTHALSRVFIPRRVKVVPDHDERLRELESPNFDPRETAFVETPVELPQECRGEAEIREEIPTRVKIETRMQTAGLVVLTDLWNKGWRAYLDGQNVPVLRANHAVRGVVVQQGTHSLEFRYQPTSFMWGMCAPGLAGLTLLMWAGFAWRTTRKEPAADDRVQPRMKTNRHQ